ncbi:MAG: 2-hydroxyacyl-CoA dehydratase family protein [Clostridium tyrobutyricum]|jgi:benzoyl-CoA reductase/2-hydroxyglutaryl-CoA dehydratase subunit BcrC/BadD/HgdB|uniref:double-cubane-cluster-containing anaerobic reductase n=1 Tax=Clostridium tyrobutyricum TaxID=1519 RepID=UPI002431AE52|nr:double-cubane-cluster-containing anaerobic reductase [Clostridium tyrobutyricum]MCH4198497.1 2-hydroxyacyl-CoA dehydratase family protein [Clostridium tyrobutyricum]MCH4237893.1 2-hydroxyacyl-CoA dehydratase family protein [Clostridium tyrobutyricum]MCH4259034.1 2-hydroxyacyl-CoA dehydratase family protein [Clostridium tyrobutyricum]MCI1239886.1 2-hydroxyacyl-CoA dehydratase family protein [Clostridium tyrobutyricum]MCI1652945.1 2-hydroxyacyl-CoA dehydratase family protein [Clostridium tyro
MNIKKELPEIFSSFSEARKNGFIKAKELKEKNRPLIGTFCSYMPQEIAMAAGASVVSLCSTSDETIEEAENYLPRNLCPLIKSSYGFAKTDKCPYFYFSDLIVGETTCDGKKKMYEYLGEFKPVHVMQLPNTQIGENSFKLWKDEIIRLKEKIEDMFDIEIKEEDIKQAILLKNRERQAIKDFYSLGKLKPSALTGMDILNVVNGATFKFNKEESIDEISDLTEKIIKSYKEGKRLLEKPRILITGCPIGGAADKVVKAVEKNGAYVVAFENCTVSKANELLVDENKDVFDALTEKYLAIGCSCMTPNKNRLETLKNMMREYKVDGVIDVILQACHTYAVESFSIKRFVNSNGIPYIPVEIDYSQSNLGQLNTRIGAFIEML